MGRGLSHLQREILRLAYQNRQEAVRAYADAQAHPDRYPGRPTVWGRYQGLEYLATEGPDVRPHHVLGELYGFSEHTVKMWRGRPIPWSQLRNVLYGQKKFDREEIGLARYASATSATKKALERLVRRGLLTREGWGYRLTDRGQAVAEGLLAGQQQEAGSE